MAGRIHPTAVVSPRAELGVDVVIGPYVVIEDRVRIGARCVIHPFAVIGGPPQIRKRPGERGDLVIGDDNVIREHVTVNVSAGERTTHIGSNNLLMAGCHVAHDVVIGSNCVVANGVQLWAGERNLVQSPALSYTTTGEIILIDQRAGAGR